MRKPRLQKYTVPTVAAFDGGADADAGMVVSTSTPDREGDRVLATGVDLSNFQRNAPLLWAHDAKSLPIGAITSVTVEPDRLRASWRWLENDPFSSRVKNAWSQGVVRAASIGFTAHASTPNSFGGMDFTSWELLEISLVPIGANQDAVRTMKALGLLPEAPRDDEDAVLILRDGTPTGDLPGGRTSCPGPSGISGGTPPCPHTFPKPVSACPALHCPLRGENVSDRAHRSGIVLVDPLTVESDLGLATLVASVITRQVQAEVTRAAAHVVRMTTGKID